MVGTLGNLSTAIQSSISGQKLSQSCTALVSQNITNAYTEGYSRKEALYSTRVLGGIGSGVEIDSITRITDELKVDQLRTLTSSVQKLEVMQQVYSEIVGNLGQPGKDNSLCASLSDFQSKIQELSLRPSDEGTRNALLLSAQNLCTDIQTLANQVQTLRQQADMEIYNQVTVVNGYLSHIADVNQEIFYTQGKGDSIAELLDDQDQTLQNIAQYLDIRVQRESDGTVSIFTNDGQSLVQSTAQQLTFYPASGINAASTYPGALNGILVNTNPTTDITNSISEGSIGGYLAMRDTELPNFQAALDELTATLRDQVNIIHNEGTSSTPPQTLTGTRVITGTNPVVGLGTVEVAVIDNTTGDVVETTTINLATIGTFNAIQTQINGMVNASAVFTAGGALEIQAGNANYGIAVASVGSPSAYITDTGINYGFSDYFGLNDFFVTGSVVTGSQPGISSMIQVNSFIANNPNFIANTTLDTTAVVGQQAVYPGGDQTLRALTAMFGTSFNYNAVGNLPSLSGTINSYAAIMIQNASGLAQNYENSANRQNELWNLSSASLENIRGVNIMQEVMDLMKWQRSQTACVQVYKTATEMLNELIKLGG